MHNYHLIAHLPDTCRSQAWEDADGNILSVADKLRESYHHRRQVAFRATFDLLWRLGTVEHRSQGPLYATPGKLLIAKEEYETALVAFNKAIEALRQDEHCTFASELVTNPVNSDGLEALRKTIYGKGIPTTPHDEWHESDVSNGKSYIQGCCPNCGELAVVLELDRWEIDSFATQDTERLHKGQHYSGSGLRVRVDYSRLAREWRPLGITHIRSYDWFEKCGAPGITAHQTPDNYTYWYDFDMVVAIGKEGWPQERPPRCKYCEWIMRWGV